MKRFFAHLLFLMLMLSASAFPVKSTELLNWEELSNWGELLNWTELGNVADVNPEAVDASFVLDLDRQDSTFTRSSDATCWGYTDTPSVSVGPVLITVPSDVECIVGALWGGSSFSIPSYLHPTTNENTGQKIVRKFVAYQNWKSSESIIAGDQRRLTTDAGNKMYCTATTSGTTSASQPSFIDTASSVTDNTVTWTVNGYATIDGTLLEDTATQKLLNSDAPATQTTGSLGVGSWTLSVYGTGSALASGNTAVISGSASATEGSPNTFTVSTAGTVDITVTGLLDYFQLESGGFPTSIIISAGSEVTRAATTLSNTTAGILTAESGAGRIVGSLDGLRGLSSEVVFNSSNAVQTEQIVADFGSGTSARFFKRVGGSVIGPVSIAYTPPVDGRLFCLEWYYDNAEGFAVRAYDIGDTPPAFVVNADTTPIELQPVFEIGSRVGTLRLNWSNLSTEVSTSKEDFGW
jgi:hypothetical protein